MASPNPRQYVNKNSKPGGWYSVEDFLNELTVQILSSGTVKGLSIAILDTTGAHIDPSLSQASTGTLSSVAGNASSVTILAANTSRKGAIIHNDSAAILYIAFAATATSSAFSYRVNPFDTLELKPSVYTGVISGIWASATGSARITELT